MERSHSDLAAAVFTALLSIAVIAPTEAAARTANIWFSVHATYCENSTCEPVTLQISAGDNFIISKWGNHRETIRIVNIDAPNHRARCVGERESAERATVRLGQLLTGSTFTTARVSTDRRGNSIAFVSINRRDLGHQLAREQLVWPWEPKHRPWC
ncbi:thermonuclease family protein [Rhizobium sp. 2YAF20]|uniref:thermonuclease family protein n=1 Tax=Rhizobium sp. 2YAF20 TaxID=3233027 RepID=UPI003F97FB86